MRVVVIEDRRWMWQLARISGEYNTTDKGTIEPATKKSARELAQLCLEAMNETGYNIAELPTTAYPEVSWTSASAASAFEELCSTFGCVPVLEYRTDRVRVWKNNVGPRPQVDSRAMDSTPSSEPQIVPPELIFEGGPTQWQRDLLLEPVGIEKVSEREVIKPIDDLSYKPTAGWDAEDPSAFYGVATESRDLARRSVYRMWRLKPPFILTPPPNLLSSSGKQSQKAADDIRDFYTIKVDELWRILPLSSKQLGAAGLDADGSPRAAQLVGAFMLPKRLGYKNNTDTSDVSLDPDVMLDDDDKFIWPEKFSIDSDKGIVVTNEPIKYLESTGKILPRLRLRTSFSLRHRESRHQVCCQYRYRPPTPTPGAILPEVVKHDDAIFEILERSYGSWFYDPTSPAITKSPDFVALAQVYLAEKLNALYPDEAITIPYKGFVFSYDLSGTIRTITWTTGPQGGTTQVDYAIERPDLRETQTQLRERAALIATQQKLKAGAARLNKLFSKRGGSIL